MNRMILIVGLVVLLLAPGVWAEDPDRLVVNSEDWKDVYSLLQYGVLIDRPAHFLVSNQHATILLGSLPPDDHLWVISSDQSAYIRGYEALLSNRGYSVEEFTYDNVNLELGRQLETNDYIVVSPAYGYNAVSVAPYAALTSKYVLFVSEQNLNDVLEFLSERTVNSMIIYGHVDREVGAALSQFNPEIINNQGDRFLNNVEIVKRYQEVKEAKQVILTNGEFIEQEIMKGTEPVVFIGSNNVPEAIREYIHNSPVEIGVLIGNELVGTATFIRREVGISVFVKFAQGARRPEGRISQVEALDMFYLPTYSLNLVLESLKYNRATEQLEVTLRNPEEQAVYLIGTYTLRDISGESITVGDVSANFMDGNELKTFWYPDVNLAEGDIAADVFVIYGESPGSLEKELRLSTDIESVRVVDNCQVSIEEVSINTRKRQFSVDIKNVGDAHCYVDVELVDLVVAGARNSYSSEDVEYVKTGQTKSVKVQVEDFETEDLEDNQEVLIKAFHGERENALIKLAEGKFALSVKRGDYVFYTLILLIILLLYLIYKKRKKNQEEQRPPSHHAHHHPPHSHTPPHTQHQHPSHQHTHHQSTQQGHQGGSS